MVFEPSVLPIILFLLFLIFIYSMPCQFILYTLLYKIEKGNARGEVNVSKSNQGTKAGTKVITDHVSTYYWYSRTRIVGFGAGQTKALAQGEERPIQGIRMLRARIVPRESTR
jgi:hypothetical protein